MKLQTIVDIKPSEWKIGYEDKILMIGSCFSDEIGEQMAQRYLHVIHSERCIIRFLLLRLYR